MPNLSPDDPGANETGFPSNLTPEQEVALRTVWRKLDELVFANLEEREKAAQGAQEGKDEDLVGAQAKADEKVDSGKSAMSGISSDDKVKEAERKKKELEEAQKAFENVSPEKIRNLIWRSVMADSPDSLILRFLRARDFDPDAAFAMLGSSVAWRLSINVPELLSVGEAGLGGFRDGLGGQPADEAQGQKFIQQYKDGKAYCYGTDVNGRPVVYINVAKHYIGYQSVLALQRYVIIAIESARTSLAQPAEEGCGVFNMSGFGLSNMDFFAIKYMLDIFGSYYPSTINKLLIYNPPFYFQPFWMFIKPLIWEEIRKRVIFVYGDEIFQHIPKEHVPKDLGGASDWKYEYPEPTEETEKNKSEDDPQRKKFFEELDKLNAEFEHATREWVDGVEKNGFSEEQVKEVKKKREQIQAKRYVLCRRYDHLWRASTVLSRSGAVKNYGSVSWTYKLPDGEKTETWGLTDEEILAKAGLSTSDVDGTAQKAE